MVVEITAHSEQCTFRHEALLYKEAGKFVCLLWLCCKENVFLNYEETGNG